MRHDDTPIQLALSFDLKRCCRCKASKPLDAFNRNRSRPDGLQPQCRDCQRKSGREYWQRHPEKLVEHYAANREAIIKRASTWNRENTERRAEINQAHYERHHEKITQYRFANRERQAAYSLVWRRENKHVCKEHAAIRRARIRSTRVEPVSYAEILERDGYVCHICGEGVEPNDMHFDHVIPLAKGGTHTYDNIKVAHALCNQRKKDRILPARKAITNEQ